MMKYPSKTDRTREFMELCDIEPELVVLAEKVRRHCKKAKPGKRFCFNEIWYGVGKYKNQGLKDELVKLVGWTAKSEELRTCKAYDIAYEYLYKNTPDCHKCGCYQGLNND